MGGDDSSYNVVQLTAREHFICHRLLVKMTEGRDRYKMVFALNLMMTPTKKLGSFRYYPCGRVYGQLKKDLSVIQREERAKMTVEERSAKFGNRRGTTQTTETKNKISKSHMGVKKSGQHALNISKGRKGIKFSETHLLNLSISHKNSSYVQPEEKKRRIACAMKLVWAKRRAQKMTAHFNELRGVA